MDYIGFNHLVVFLLVLAAAIQLNSCHSDRDIILTPNETQQYAGKIIYFSPADISVRSKENQTDQKAEEKEAETTPTTPWESALKHAIYLVLNNKVDGNFNSSDLITKDALQRANYVKKGNATETHQFGDIVPVANGWLERNDNNQMSFVEMDQYECKKNCSFEEARKRNVTAFWLVEKIRHRDIDRGHRYELRFTIFPVKKTRYDSKRETGHKIQLKTRSFIVRDYDYPKLFKNSPQAAATNKIQKRMFDLAFPFHQPSAYENLHIPFNVNPYHGSFPDDLNLGEYFPKNGLLHGNHVPLNIQHLSGPSSATQSSHLLHPDHIRFPTSASLKDEVQGQNNNFIPTGSVTATHLHHHYYLGKNNLPIDKGIAYGKGNYFASPSHSFHPNFQQTINAESDTTEEGIHQTKTSTKPSLNHRFQTPFSLPDQLPAPPAQQPPQQPMPPTTINQVFQPLPIMFPFPYMSPNIAGYYNHHFVPSQPMEPLNPHLTPIMNVHPRYFNRPIVVNDLSANDSVGGKFKPNQKYENTRYSEPDPIYHSDQPPLMVTPIATLNYPTTNEQNYNEEHSPIVNSSGHNAGSYILTTTKAKYKIGQQESTAINDDGETTDQTDYPDSINAQLPPPEHDEDLSVPYVESSVVKEKTVSPTLPTTDTQTKQFKYSSNYKSIDVQSTLSTPIARTLSHLDKLRRGRYRFYPKSTTEKPILKWMPKRTRLQEAKNITNDTITTDSLATTTAGYGLTTSEENVITVTPINYKNQEETQTSISTSISILVGTRPDAHDSIAVHTILNETTTETSTVDKPLANLQESLAQTLSSTSHGNIETIKGHLETIQTNTTDVRLFKASEEAPLKGKVDDRIAASILKHARNLQ